jgi:hypothetical protein
MYIVVVVSLLSLSKYEDDHPPESGPIKDGQCRGIDIGGDMGHYAADYHGGSTTTLL